ncbi:MAG: penicillin acylase family protein, partial [Enterobacterales bacterium]|nr:penicillin acylase family protein [Enterobacterales bacterium]
DNNNNIAWWATGKLIKRPQHVNSSMLLDGASGVDEPLGYYGFDKNPQILNPERGFLLTANNQPADTGIGLIPGYYVARDRAMRIEQLLLAKDDWDAESIKSMLMDSTTPLVKYVQQRALTVIDRAKLSVEEAKHLDTLLNWDGVHDIESSAPSLFYYYKKQLLTALFSDEMEEHNFSLFLSGFLRQKTIWSILDSPKSPWWDDINTASTESMSDTLTTAWVQTIAKIDALGLNSDTLKWRHVLRMVHQHAFGVTPQMAKIFNVGPLPAAGGNETINNMVFKLGKEPFTTAHGPSTRRIVDFADMTNSWGINPTGQSGVVNDKHYDDQAIMYSKGDFRPQWFTPEQIKANTASSLILLPK